MVLQYASNVQHVITFQYSPQQLTYCMDEQNQKFK